MKGAPRTDCAVDAAMSVIEGRWKTVIICILARNGEPMRFNQLINRIDGISPRIFTLQLRELESDGIITRTVVSTSPKYVEYSLSEKGLSLIPILQMLSEWGLKHMFPNMVSFPGEVVSEPDKADV
ncbi:MAG: helix-turn-helix transcriptional regulator [Candidatus Methanomethylophilus sp.]|jgi:DNA-binding HxlR family transcriptional regulator|nr:helix-turn-helix transcriptional regulator [Methanomethylophilus sp.]MBQ5483485.1 helix-turn-helix transcriptional regulator [Methanomethylophilus sp.]